MRYPRVFSQVLIVEVVIASAVFAVVLGALLVALVRRRAGRGVTPSPRSERNTLELFYVGGLAAIAAGLVVYTALANHRETRPRPASVRVDVLAYQWCWGFSYPGTRVSRTTNCDAGKLPTLVVPTGRTVRLELRSKDVIHSFWVPALRWKMDVFPHHVNAFTLRLDRTGEWVGRCAEFCGYRHYVMDFRLRAVSPRQYGAWLAAQGHAGVAA